MDPYGGFLSHRASPKSSSLDWDFLFSTIQRAWGSPMTSWKPVDDGYQMGHVRRGLVARFHPPSSTKETSLEMTVITLVED